MAKFNFSVVDGNNRQRQGDGHYCTLLHDILKQQRSAVKEVQRDAMAQTIRAIRELQRHRRDAVSEAEVNLSSGDIVDALRKTLTYSIPTLNDVSMCVFIDGLDGFKDDIRDTYDRVDELNRWTHNINSAQVKICPASREDPPFTDRLVRYATVRIHNLTCDEIARYATTRLHGIASTKQVSRLAQVIADRSEGIFLFVKLVLTTLRIRMRRSNDSQSILRIVERFPRDLVDMIASIIQSIDESDRRGAQQTYCRLEAAREYSLRIDIPALLFLPEYTQDVKFAVRPEFAPTLANQADIAGRMVKAQADLLSTFKGLCETRESAVVLVDRSVGEYLEGSQWQYSLFGKARRLFRNDRVQRIRRSVKYYPCAASMVHPG